MFEFLGPLLLNWWNFVAALWGGLDVIAVHSTRFADFKQSVLHKHRWKILVVLVFVGQIEAFRELYNKQRNVSPPLMVNANVQGVTDTDAQGKIEAQQKQINEQQTEITKGQESLKDTSARLALSEAQLKTTQGDLTNTTNELNEQKALVKKLQDENESSSPRSRLIALLDDLNPEIIQDLKRGKVVKFRGDKMKQSIAEELQGFAKNPATSKFIQITKIESQGISFGKEWSGSLVNIELSIFPPLVGAEITPPPPPPPFQLAPTEGVLAPPRAS